MSEPADLFAREARLFCDFVARAAASSLTERLTGTRVRLLALYAAAIALPEHPPCGVQEAAASPKSPPCTFGKYDYYLEVFDPYQFVDPTMGSLDDDVLDIYGDVGRGLALWDGGWRIEAVWQWRLHFSHWGRHAVDALRALHFACDPRTPEPNFEPSPLPRA